MKYAQINEDGRVHTVSEHPTAIVADNMIPLPDDADSADYFGKRYNSETETFEVIPTG